MHELASLLEAAKKLQPEVTALRRAIHQEPELGLENPATRARVLAQLAGLPLEIAQHAKSSGVVATLRGALPGKRILLRADTDALPMPEDNELAFRSRRPGAMHACGHDAHTAMLVGAARLLSQQRETLAGEIVFMFQPGEEGFAGARVMLEEREHLVAEGDLQSEPVIRLGSFRAADVAKGPQRSVVEEPRE